TMGRPGLGPMTFHHRPELAQDQLILAEGVLEVIERELLGIAKYRSLLVQGGQHVKRGLLLYGPPGNGKTLTIRYLLGRLREHTVILLTGTGLTAIAPAASLARTLEPSIVVLEDVDLVAAERTGYASHPVLFSVLNELDGIAEDADVAFVLTTNRADLLEPALAARPGRVDLAVEIGVPDDDGRRRLIELYGRHLQLQINDLEGVIARTRGVAASFMKELVRKAALLAAHDSDGSQGLTVTEVHLTAALDELLSEQSALTRVLLGAAPQHPPHLSRSAGFLSER
ncbi:MAG: ATP-binding protein, partial [Actinomycetota bacterium]|nr:ATP-binding protein [Actinomycetota bacterium]